MPRFPSILAALAATVALATPAAATPGLVILACDVTYARYGVGVSTATASCTASAAHNGPVTITLTTFQDAATCPVSGEASGRMSGAVTGDIRWDTTRRVVTSGGNHDGSGGILLHQVTSPVGNPCGSSNAAARLLILLLGA